MSFSSGMSGSAKSGFDKWTSSLHFYDYDDPEPKVSQINCRDVATFKFPKLEQQVVELFGLLHPLQSWRSFFHEYIVIRTDKNELWSFEKNQEGIFLQRETESEAKNCLKHLHGKKRSSFYTIKWNTKSFGLVVSVQDILNWIMNTGELSKRYNLLEDNCQHFAARLKDAILEMYSSNFKIAVDKWRKQKLMAPNEICQLALLSGYPPS
jgi:hypothetical protein